MRKDWTGMYHYKGFTLRYSETYQEWNSEANFLLDMFSNKNDDSKICDFISYHVEDIEPQKTIAKMKTAINQAIKNGLKEKLIEQFEKFMAE